MYIFDRVVYSSGSLLSWIRARICTWSISSFEDLRKYCYNYAETLLKIFYLTTSFQLKVKMKNSIWCHWCNCLNVKLTIDFKIISFWFSFLYSVLHSWEWSGCEQEFWDVVVIPLVPGFILVWWRPLRTFGTASTHQRDSSRAVWVRGIPPAPGFSHWKPLKRVEIDPLWREQIHCWWTTLQNRPIWGQERGEGGVIYMDIVRILFNQYALKSAITTLSIHLSIEWKNKEASKNPPSHRCTCSLVHFLVKNKNVPNYYANILTKRPYGAIRALALSLASWSWCG